MKFYPFCTNTHDRTQPTFDFILATTTTPTHPADPMARIPRSRTSQNRAESKLVSMNINAIREESKTANRQHHGRHSRETAKPRTLCGLQTRVCVRPRARVCVCVLWPTITGDIIPRRIDAKHNGQPQQQLACELCT